MLLLLVAQKVMEGMLELDVKVSDRIINTTLFVGMKINVAVLS